MTDPFLLQSAKLVSDSCGEDPTAIAVVLPSQRAAVYFRKYYGELSQKVRFVPNLMTLDKFVSELTPIAQADRIDLLFRLFRSHKEVWQSESESFERFMKWGSSALTDFSEIDAYLIDPKAFFRDLTNLKELDAWSLNEEDLTENQQNYVWFWKQFGALYNHFRESLLRDSVGYSGMLFRDAAEHVEERANNLNYQKIFFCGFNALSASEEKIMHHLKAIGVAEVLWDADHFYIDYPQHEAGYFLRKNFKRFQGEPRWLNDNFLKVPKTINIIASPNEVAQCDYMGHVLGAEDANLRTAVVLANPNLLMPVLNGIPESIEGVNVTMGLSTRHSPLHSLFDLLFEWMNARTDEGLYHYRHIARMLSHPYMNFSAEIADANRKLTAFINDQNKIFIRTDWIRAHCNHAELSDLFESISISEVSAQNQLDAQFKLLEFILGSMQGTDKFPIEKEYIYHYLRVLRRIKELVHQFPTELYGEAYVRVFGSLSAGEKLNFVGEPLGGLQIMGMLETRALDFDNLIILSCNEHIMPGTSYDQSLIPYELKKFHQLPTKAEKEAIYAYYFYRLIQGAQNVHLVYSTDSNDWQGSEPSRYIAQLKYDLKEKSNIQLHTLITHSIDAPSNIPAIQIDKDSAVVEQLIHKLKSGLSPSALNTFIKCPLDYYFTYVIGYREENEVEETIEHSTLGSAVHTVLEKLYLPHKGMGVLKPEDIEAMQPKVKDLMHDAFNEHYNAESVRFGMNNLIFQVAVKYVRRFLSAEIKSLKELAENGQFVEILDLEKKLKYTLPLETEHGNIEVLLTGNADRIDKVGDTIRVVDYKTGMVKQDDVKLKEPETELIEPDKAKALQLLMYGRMYSGNSDQAQKVTIGNISMRNLGDFFMPVTWEGKTILNSSDWDRFESILRGLLKEMISPHGVLSHKEGAKYCNFCDPQPETD